MKKHYLLIFALFVCGSVFAQAPIFVDSDATGANNGSSWADAYTDFQSAIDDTSSPNVWIAAGTYIPGMDGYVIGRQMNIYGSFVGNESSVEDRDISGNPTFFSGDVDGDDVGWDSDIWSQVVNLPFRANRDSFISATLPVSDNLRNVMVVNGAAAEVLLDGIIFKGGNGLNFDRSLDVSEYAGAGIFSEARLKVANCRFTENISGNGAGVYIKDINSSGSIFTNCVFDNNGAYLQGAMNMSSTSNVEISDCKFNNNYSLRGTIFLNSCVTVTVKNCDFEDNVNEGGFGAAFFNTQSDNVDIVDCKFRRNVARNGGAIYSDHRDYGINQQSEDNFLIQNCVFEENSGTRWGGAISVFSSSFQALGCVFEKNKSVDSGGAIAAFGDVKRIRINDCDFEFNESSGPGVGFGGAVSLFGDTTFVVVQNSRFKNNSAGIGGGACHNANNANTTFDKCTFEANSSFAGGAIFHEDNETFTTLKESDFLSNQAERSGGGIHALAGAVTIDKCEFEANTASIGGGINIRENAMDTSLLNLSNTIFNFNEAGSQGGGLNILNATSNIVSCVFSNNVVQNSGIGGAISVIASGSSELNVNVTNSTLVSNTGGIATSATDTTTSNLFLQNNAFVLNNNNYRASIGVTTIESKGGNFSSDETLSSFLTHSMDLDNNQSDPKFVDGFENFRILEGSVFIDAGVADRAPATDLDGNPRVGNVDIGAFEFTGMVSSNDYFELENGLSLSPNPVSESTVLTLENDWVGDFEYYLYDRTGKILEKSILNKVGNVQKYPISVKFLMQGDYYIVLKKGNATSVERMLKQ